jgi:hypothetical protein
MGTTKENLKKILLRQSQKIFSPKKYIPFSSDILKLFQLPADILNRTLITSFYTVNIHHSIVDSQRRIFELFDLPLIQQQSQKTHSQFLEETLKNSDKEFIIFFDIDAIPLQKDAIFLILAELVHGAVLAGAMQTAAHINNGMNNYVGPFFMGIQKNFYARCNFPSLKETDSYDVAGVLTHEAMNLSLPVKYWLPTDVEIKKWKLYKMGYFGPGTTYNGLVYHAFDSRSGSYFNFVNKCRKVLNTYKK